MTTSPPLPHDERVLLLLGLLTSQDRHGYEINDFIEHQMGCMIDLKKATAYQLLDRLEQHQLIESRTEQQGNRPQRKVYALTEAGHRHSLELLAGELAHEKPLILSGNVALMFAEHLPPKERQAALEEWISQLEKRLAVFDRLLELPHLTQGVRLATDRVRTLSQADLGWLRRTAAELDK